MKLRMIWQVLDKVARLPLSYKYEISSWLYKLMAEGNSDFAQLLHQQGFAHGHRKFKFFTFSDLKVPREGRAIEGDRLLISAQEVALDVSMFLPQASDALISGLLKQPTFHIGDKISQGHFRIEKVSHLPLRIPRGPVHLRTESPLVVDGFNAEQVSRHHFLAPDDPDFGNLLLANLQKKYMAAFKHGLTQEMIFPSTLAFRLLDREPKRKRILIKAHTNQAHSITGYYCDFELIAPPPLVEFGLLAGFGTQNPQGFGATKIIPYSRPSQNGQA